LCVGEVSPEISFKASSLACTPVSKSPHKQKVYMKTIRYSILSPCLSFTAMTCFFLGTLFFCTSYAAAMGLLTPIHLYQAKRHMEAKPQPTQIQTSIVSSKRADMTKGYWYSRQTRDKYCIRFQENDNESLNWGMSKCFDKNTFENKQENVFQLKRETGTLTLNGRLEEENSEGTYVFTEDGSFKKYLADNNIISKDENMMFHLYLADMNRTYVEFLKKQYAQIDGNRLLEVAIHGISQVDYQAYISLFEKYGQKKPSMQEVIEAKIHGIDQEYVENLQAIGFNNLPLRKMMEAKIHGINADYIDMLHKQGFPGLGIDQIISAKIHGLSSTSIKQLQSLGYKDLSLDKMIEAKIHGVNSTYVQSLQKAGFSNLPINKLIEAKIHGVDGQFIDEAKSKGHQLETISQYIDLKIHGFNRTSHKN
jgi:hypothetical protein